MPAVFVPNNSQVPEIAQTSSFAASAGLFYAIAGTPPITATLPTAIGNAGRVVRFRCVNGYAGVLTIATTAGQVIGSSGLTSQILYAGETALVQSDGANWVRTGGVIIPAHARMLLSANQSISANTATQVNLNLVDFDNTGLLTSISGHFMTIFRSGFYWINTVGVWNGVNGSLEYTFITQARKNSVAALFTQVVGGPYTPNFSMAVPVNGSILLAAGDTVDMLVYQNSSSGPGVAPLSGGSSVGAPASFLELTEIPTW